MLFYPYPDAFAGRIHGIKLPKKLLSERRVNIFAAFGGVRLSQRLHV